MAEDTALPLTLGFVGLGAMGKPMVINLANKLPSGAIVHVHDVVEAAVEELCASYPNRVVRCANAKEVAENSVCLDKDILKHLTPLLTWKPTPTI
jgi:3-hydroxyisobutyrate dehydrogenase-like beta-hydroxyacid dehydrogenase